MGGFTGIDKNYYNNSLLISPVTYGLYNVTEADPSELPRIKTDNQNCLARRAVEHFNEAVRCGSLTPKMRKVIEAGQGDFSESGAFFKMVATLEKNLRLGIVTKDTCVEIFDNSVESRTQNLKTIELVLYAGYV